MFHIQL